MDAKLSTPQPIKKKHWLAFNKKSKIFFFFFDCIKTSVPHAKDEKKKIMIS